MNGGEKDAGWGMAVLTPWLTKGQYLFKIQTISVQKK